MHVGEFSQSTWQPPFGHVISQSLTFPQDTVLPDAAVIVHVVSVALQLHF